MLRRVVNRRPATRSMIDRSRCKQRCQSFLTGPAPPRPASLHLAMASPSKHADTARAELIGRAEALVKAHMAQCVGRGLYHSMRLLM